MKNKRFVLLILVFLLILSLGCGLLGSNEEEPVAVEEAAPAEVVEPVEEAATPEPDPPTEAPPTEIPPTKVPPTPEPTPIPSWRMPAPDGSQLMMQDSDKNPDWEEIVALHAATLAIPKPYYYELYVLPGGTKFPGVEAHYKDQMKVRKYTMARNEQGASQVYLMTFLYSLDKTSKNAVLFYAELSNRAPMVLVIYSNPVE
jgi:hypothetical protein